MLGFPSCPSLGTGAAGTHKFLVVLVGRGDLFLNPLVPPTAVKEPLKDWTGLAPLAGAHARNPRELHIIIGQEALHPIVDYEKHIGAMQRRIEVRGFLEIIADVQWHSG